MPITIHPCQQPLSSVSTGPYSNKRATDAKDLLERCCDRNVFNKCGEIFQSSFATGGPSYVSSERSAVTILSKSAVLPARNGNGFVDTALEAYARHHHLVIRPDDVWIAILTQFNLYVNANAELFRHLFVEHEGKKELVIVAQGSRDDVHFGRLAEQMGMLVQENVKDRDLREWIVPDFSTTTENDVIVASVVMMATLQTFFNYGICIVCGLPAVTLLGEKADWESLLGKAERLQSYGTAAAKWHSLLKPVLAAFVRSFDEPDSERTKDFWQSIAHYSGGGCGPRYLSGWITAFCFFDREGEQLYSERRVSYAVDWDGDALGCLELDGVLYHRITTKEIPPAYAQVNVKVGDMGTVMVAGLVGMEVSDSGAVAEGHDGKNDTVQPVAGWWLFEETKSRTESISTKKAKSRSRNNATSNSVNGRKVSFPFKKTILSALKGSLDKRTV